MEGEKRMNTTMHREGKEDSLEGEKAAGSQYTTPVMSAVERVHKLAEEDIVVLFTKSECYVCVAAKALLTKLGTRPTIIQLDKEEDGEEIEAALLTMLAAPPSVPVVFVGGKLLGGMEQLMGSHIRGSLLPLLKESGAVWF